ncbi:MAG TPA: hypothetical protein DHV16_07555 [Nitrospiraceae bacterium]|nr:MAG: hypothetical protein A2Z82_00580 [Nitrospirae bacterium GWA2_46_11]OGW24747.1 MAG: hypothetical protein A2X55_06975 [Nitrospirae bacterium GWB2_47_37]HAK88651.1 hypothetical protein [Nitrospiraceae bacterium]HCZ12093.1 hypothetical protein [Nitrospiraceae bacterium]
MTDNLKIRTAVIFAFFLLLSPFSSAYAESDIKEGYDENTEITIKGTVTEIIHVKRGPVILRVKTSGKSYTVVTAPHRYLSGEAITFNTDSLMEITGSKYFGRDGNLYIIGRQIKDLTTGKTIMLRDSSCKPLWRNHRMHDRRLP